MPTINLLGALDRNQQAKLACLFSQYAHPRLFVAKHGYLVKVNDGIQTVAVSHTIISRVTDCSEHPGRIWLDVLNFEVLGSGGFGEIVTSTRSFRVENMQELIIKDRTDENKIEYVIKYMQATDKYPTAMLLDLAKREIIIYGLLYLPNKKHLKIPTQINGDIAFLIPRLPGINLSSLVRQPAPKLDIGRIFNIFMKMALEVHRFHETTKRIHLDIKLGNLLYSHEQNKVSICDFGMSMSTEQINNDTSCFGTHGYLAPEMKNGELISIQTDIFSFAVTILRFIQYLDLAGPEDKLYQYRDEIDDVMHITTNPADLSILSTLQPKNCYTNFVTKIKDNCQTMKNPDPSERLSLLEFYDLMGKISELYIEHYQQILNNICVCLDELLIQAQNPPDRLSYLNELCSDALQEWKKVLPTQPTTEDRVCLVDQHLDSMINSMQNMIAASEANTTATASNTPAAFFNSSVEIIKEEDSSMAAKILASFN